MTIASPIAPLLAASALALLATPSFAGQSRSGMTPPMAPTDAVRDKLPDPKAKNEAAAKVELGARPDVTINEIKFVGAGVPPNVAKAARKFVGKPASAENLTKLAAAMTKAYNRSSVALFTLVIPEQDLSGGVVKVASAEGHITNVTLSGDTKGGPAPLVASMVKPLPEIRPLTRAQIERVMGNVEDIPGLEIKSGLQMSGEPGGVALGLELDAARPRVGLGFSSRTSQYVRDGVFDAIARGYSLLRSGDETSLSAASSVDFKALRYVSLVHDTPVGSKGTRLSFSGAALQTKPVGPSIDGRAWSGGLGLRHPLIRGAHRNLSLDASLDYLDSRNALFGSQIAAERTWIASANLLWRFNEEKTVAAIRVGGAQGLDIFNAMVDPLVGDTGFRYVDLGVEANQAIGKKALLRVASQGRYTENRLPAAQRFSVGGATFGRAFDDGLINGDRGFAGFTELAFRPFQKGRFIGSEVYVFGDYARVTILDRGATPGATYALGSWGGGARLGYTDKASIGVELAKPWKRPVPTLDDDWRVSVNWKLSLRP